MPGLELAFQLALIEVWAGVKTREVGIAALVVVAAVVEVAQLPAVSRTPTS